MGFFQFPFTNKQSQQTASPSSSQPAASAQSQPAAPPKPAPAQEAPKLPEVLRILMTMSSNDPAKLEKFFAELIRNAIYKWHHIQGRVGLHSDGKKVRIELKGMHEDVLELIKWCKMDHYGVHASYVEPPYKLSSIPYSGLFQKKVGSWS